MPAKRRTPRKARDFNEAPHDPRTEAALLGAVLFDPRALKMIPRLKPEHFFVAAHRLIFAAMLALDAQALAVDAVTVIDQLKDSGDLTRAGGPEAVLHVAASMASADNVTSYERIIRGAAFRRRVIAHGEKLRDLGYDTSFTPDEIGGAVTDFANHLDTGRDTGEPLVTVSAAIDRAFAQVHERIAHGGVNPHRVPVGIPTLDNLVLTGGLTRGEFVGILAPPDSGKSLLKLTMLLAAARAGFTGLTNDTEDPPERDGVRAAAQLADLSARLIQTGKITTHNGEHTRAMTAGEADAQWQAARAQADPLPVYFHKLDSAPWEQTLLDIKRRILTMPRPPDLICFDHLNDVPNYSQGPTPAYYKIVVGGLRNLLREFNAAGIILGQPTMDARRGKKTGGRLNYNDWNEGQEAVNKSRVGLVIEARWKTMTAQELSDAPRERGLLRLWVDKNNDGIKPNGPLLLRLNERNLTITDETPLSQHEATP